MTFNKTLWPSVGADLSALGGFSALQMNKLNSIIESQAGIGDSDVEY